MVLTWNWRKWNAAVIGTRTTRFASTLPGFVLDIQKADPEKAPAPVCIFTNGTFAYGLLASSWVVI